MADEEQTKHKFEPHEAEPLVCKYCGRKQFDPVHFVADGGKTKVKTEDPRRRLDKIASDKRKKGGL